MASLRLSKATERKSRSRWVALWSNVQLESKAGSIEATYLPSPISFHFPSHKPTADVPKVTVVRVSRGDSSATA